MSGPCFVMQYPFCNYFTEEENASCCRDNCIQNIHLGRYIVEYTVGNLVLRRRTSGAEKRDFRAYSISDDIPSQMKKIEYGYPHSNAILQFRLKWEHC